jgi:S-(hydroxymethyl)glutathione dehydrogenase/alcohol dehydrogenase
MCDLGQYLGFGKQILDQTSRHHVNGRDLGIMCLLGTFAKHTVVSEASCIKIDDDVPLDRACLVGCGVTTGWGSAVYAAGVKPGDDVVVVGIGGIGASALQGARLAGAARIFAVDPVEWKREQAMKFGATHVAPGVDEAFGIVHEATMGRMANSVIVTMGVGRGDMLGAMLSLAAKRGRVVVTNLSPAAEFQANINLMELTLLEKQVIGSLFGSANPRADIPRLLALHRQGQLDLDGLVTRTYKLEDVNQGYQDMRDGKNIRGVMLYE